MSTDAAHKRGWQIGEVVFGVPLLVAIALQWVVPLAFPRGWLTLALLLGGAALIMVSVALIIQARQELAEHSQPTDPGQATTNVVTTGVFSISRNPIYLGAAGLLLGIALALNLPWVLVLLLPALVGCHYVLIAPEERYLAAKFGDEYRKYTASVHRWLGHARRSR